MRKVMVIVGASIAGLLAEAAVTGSVRSQGAPKSCSEAHAACKSQTRMSTECEAERQWCLKTGTFANPKTKSVSTGLQKR